MIFCFSGTGNSLLVARELASRTGHAVTMLERELLSHPSRHLFELSEGEDVIWVFPVYSWGVPPVVRRFIRKAKIKMLAGNGATLSDTDASARHWMVATCGDDIGRTDDQWRQEVGRRGWAPRGAFSVEMPNTYVCMKGFEVDSKDVERQKLAAMPGRVRAIVEAIGRGFSDSDVVRGDYAWLKTAAVYPLFRTFCMSPAPFASDAGKCVSCGLCARECPLGNIEMKEGRPQWGPACALCLRCFHGCPTRAIDYGKASLGKAQKPVYR